MLTGVAGRRRGGPASRGWGYADLFPTGPSCCGPGRRRCARMHRAAPQRQRPSRRMRVAVQLRRTRVSAAPYYWPAWPFPASRSTYTMPARLSPEPLAMPRARIRWWPAVGARWSRWRSLDRWARPP